MKVEIIPTDTFGRLPILKHTVSFLKTIFLSLVHKIRKATFINRAREEKNFQETWISKFGLIPRGTWEIYSTDDALNYISYIIPASARQRGRLPLFKALAALNGLNITKVEHLWRKRHVNVKSKSSYIWVDVNDEDDQSKLVSLIGESPEEPQNCPTILYRATVSPRLDPNYEYALPCAEERISLRDWGSIKEYLSYLVKISLPIECIFEFIFLVLNTGEEGISAVDFYMSKSSTHDWFFSIRGISLSYTFSSSPAPLTINFVDVIEIESSCYSYEILV